MDYIEQEELDRFNSCWKQSGSCKLWKNYLDKDGYGSFYFRKKSRRAHRVAYYIENGPIKEDLVIDHICRNRNCVSIEHLRLVTKRENCLSNSTSVGAINKRKTKCKRGHIFDRKYGNQRYCSICDKNKKKRLRKKWLEEANKIAC